MKTLCIQIQLDEVSGIDKEHVLAIGEDIALNQKLINHFEIREGEEFNKSINLLFTTNTLQKLWHQIQADLFKDLTVGSLLSNLTCQSLFVKGKMDGMLIYCCTVFDKIQKLDIINKSIG